MRFVHLIASGLFGGPERQILGLARALDGSIDSTLLSFAEGGRCEPFLNEARRWGFDADRLRHDTPRFGTVVTELVARLRAAPADVLICHGYKPCLLGRIAARTLRLPVVAVSRGWTYESPKVRVYELLDRINLRWMDRVVCVSESQAMKVRRAGVPARKVTVIPNAIDVTRFDEPNPAARRELERLFPQKVRRIVGAAGRLSPEKGFSVLIEAAALVARDVPETGFVVFGDGTLRSKLVDEIAARGLADRFVLAGFRSDLDRLLPQLDMLVQSSYTEGMPNVVLEACAAGVPIVATAVGGTSEIIVAGETGRLVRPGTAIDLATHMREILADDSLGPALGAAGRTRVRESFTFEAQAERYRHMLRALPVKGSGIRGVETVGSQPRAGLGR